MTLKERIIATAYTGIGFISGAELGKFYEYAEEKLGHGVIDIMLTDKKTWERLKAACTEDFFDMIRTSSGYEESKKPPIGVVPRFTWDKWRMKELEAAIARFEKANYPIPTEFIEELRELKAREVEK